MAKLYFYYASMNAGKSTTLLQADFNYRERGMHTMLWTAALDHRSDDQAIESRIGLGADAHRYASDTDLWQRVTAAHCQTCSRVRNCASSISTQWSGSALCAAGR